MPRLGKTFFRAVAVAIGLVVVAAGVGRAADTAALTARVPRTANAIMTIDVTKLLASPLGQKESLQSKLIAGYADRPLAVPATARKVVIAAAADPIGLNAVWQIALIDLPNAPRLDPMLRKQGGYLEKIEGKDAAWSKREIFYIVFDQNTLGIVRPAARQFVARWLTGKMEVGPSPRLAAVLAAAKDADAVFAVDLDGTVGLPALKYALSMGDFPSLEKHESTQPDLLRAIASVSSMRISMKFTDKIEAEWVIDFGQSVAGLGADAKPFIVDVLKAADLYEQDVEQNWDFKADSNKLVGKGTMEFAGLTRLIALLAPGDGGDSTAEPGAATAPPVAKGGPTPTPPAAEAQNPAAAASLKYYRAISKSLDAIAAKNSPTQGSSWLIAQGRQFQQLPVLNVDPDLLAWGTAVAEAYIRAGQELALGQQKAKIASGGVPSPVAYTTEEGDFGNGTSGGDTAETRAAYRNAQQQRRVAAQTERGAAAQRALDIFNPLLTSRSKIRVDMTQKYGVEF